MSVELASEAEELLARLLRFNTVNPPGNEREAQEYLCGHLRGAGLECELLGAEPDRPNLVARVRGQEPGPTLCYLGHVDTVLAEPSEWSQDPFSGALIDGFLWGRGAIDMKSQVAAEAAAVASLVRSGWRPARGELIVVAVVDEETGGELGAQWITREHPDKVRCDMLINEGAGAMFEYDGRRLYGVCCAEKGVFRFALTTHGIAAHASLPTLGENALLKMGPLLERFGERQPSYALCDETEALMRSLGADPEDPRSAVEGLRASNPGLAAVLEPMLGVTFSPTRIRASEKINVIPSSAELKVDCRVPPGRGEDDVMRGITEVLGQNGFEIEFTERMPANRSPVASELMDALSAWISEHDPGAEVVPVILPGFSDSRHFRAAFPECTAYGFFPQRHQGLLDGLPLVHGANERIDVRDLAFASECYRDLAQKVLG